MGHILIAHRIASAILRWVDLLSRACYRSQMFTSERLLTTLWPHCQCSVYVSYRIRIISFTYRIVYISYRLSLDDKDHQLKRRIGFSLSFSLGKIKRPTTKVRRIHDENRPRKSQARCAVGIPGQTTRPDVPPVVRRIARAQPHGRLAAREQRRDQREQKGPLAPSTTIEIPVWGGEGGTRD